VRRRKEEERIIKLGAKVMLGRWGEGGGAGAVGAEAARRESTAKSIVACYSDRICEHFEFRMASQLLQVSLQTIGIGRDGGVGLLQRRENGQPGFQERQGRAGGGGGCGS
jgi:hypothetical protein